MFWQCKLVTLRAGCAAMHRCATAPWKSCCCCWLRSGSRLWPPPAAPRTPVPTLVNPSQTAATPLHHLPLQRLRRRRPRPPAPSRTGSWARPACWWPWVCSASPQPTLCLQRPACSRAHRRPRQPSRNCHGSASQATLHRSQRPPLAGLCPNPPLQRRRPRRHACPGASCSSSVAPCGAAWPSTRPCVPCWPRPPQAPSPRPPRPEQHPPLHLRRSLIRHRPRCCCHPRRPFLRVGP